jgi:hypothetical protein
MSDSNRNRASTGEELFKKYGRHETAENILDLWLLAQCLAECIVKDNYKSSSLGQLCQNLTPEGSAARREFMRRLVKETAKSAPFSPTPNDANLMALLVLFHNDLLIDLEQTSAKEIAKEIGTEIKSGLLLFPFAFGRDLYDRMQGVKNTEVRSLGYTDTLKLLDRAPAGVFHVGRYLFGPFGLIETPFRRSIPPRRDLRLQHSSDRTNRSAHRIWLSSSMRAPVNAYRAIFDDALKDTSGELSDWAGFFRRISITRKQDYDAGSEASIPYFVGEAFSNVELAKIANRVCKEDGVHKLLPKDFINRLTSDATASEELEDPKCERAELIQAILCASDAVIRSTIDDLVLNNEIVVPKGEVRTPVLNGKHYLGQWGTYFELGYLGTRVVGMFPSLAELRLKDLLRSSYQLPGGDYRQNLDWILRNVDGSSLDDKLMTYISSANPKDVLKHTILPYKAATDFACEYVNFDTKGVQFPIIDSSNLEEILSWRLGFTEKIRDGAYTKFMKAQHDAISAIPGSEDEVEYLLSMRGGVTHLFTSLETYLKQLLAFLTWALIFDHYKDENPFRYTVEKARIFANHTLLPSSSLDGDIESLTLRPLINQYHHLYNLLKSHDEANDSERPKSDYPAFTSKTTLQLFPLKHNIPFLDLRTKARKEILNELNLFATSLSKNEVFQVRNGFSHGGLQAPPDLYTVRSVFTTIRSSVQRLELAGLGLAISSYEHSESDPWGRVKHKLVSETRAVRILQEPSDLEFIGLPEPESPQLILSPAILQTSNEPLRFSIGSDSDYSNYWKGFPNYPEPSEILGVEGGIHAKGEVE